MKAFTKTISYMVLGEQYIQMVVISLESLLMADHYMGRMFILMAMNTLDNLKITNLMGKVSLVILHYFRHRQVC